MVVSETMREAPSRSRSDLDRLYAAWQKTVSPADLVAATGLDRELVRTTLAAAKAGGAADGLNGRWDRQEKVTRTKFRDLVVLGAIRMSAEPVTFEQILELVPVSRPQLYTSLARLQITSVDVKRDGTRTPRYAAS